MFCAGAGNTRQPCSHSGLVNSRWGFCTAGEVDGTHYHFTTKEEMEKGVADGLFLETAQVHNNMYGTSKKAVLDTLAEGKVAILDVGKQKSQAFSHASNACM
jgi:guanylate kinase